MVDISENYNLPYAEPDDLIRNFPDTVSKLLATRVDDAINRTAYRRSIVTSGDVDTFVTPGIYPIHSASNVANLPSNMLGELTVHGTSYVTQTYETWSNPPETYARQYVSGVWRPWSSLSWRRRAATTNSDMDEWIEPGYISILTTVSNRPIEANGYAEVFTYGSGVLQMFGAALDIPRLFIRRGTTTGNWKPWIELSTSGTLAPIVNRLEAVEASGSTGSGNGTKIVPLTMTAPGVTSSTPIASGAVRWVRRYAHAPQRVRVHVSNQNPANSVGGDTLEQAEIRVGTATEAGTLLDQSLAVTGATIPADGSELVSAWVDVPGITDGAYLAVDVSWDSGGVVQLNEGGGWISESVSAAGTAEATGERSDVTPLFCWVEAEVPASAPVIVAQGSSTQIGTATADPVGDAWVSQYAYDMGALPVILAQNGSNLSHWQSASNRWAMFPGVNLSAIADSIVVYLGGNDLSDSITVEDMQTRFTDFLTGLREVFPAHPVYLATLSPSTKPPAVEAIRRQFNDWLSTLPGAARGVIDFSGAIGDEAGEDLAPEYSADGLHPNTAGQSVLSELVAARPVTTPTLTGTQVRSLIAERITP